VGRFGSFFLLFFFFFSFGWAPRRVPPLFDLPGGVVLFSPLSFAGWTVSFSPGHLFPVLEPFLSPCRVREASLSRLTEGEHCGPASSQRTECVFPPLSSPAGFLPPPLKRRKSGGFFFSFLVSSGRKHASFSLSLIVTGYATFSFSGNR